MEVGGQAMTAFAALAAAKTKGPIVWILPKEGYGEPFSTGPYAPGLKAFLNPDRLVFVWTVSAQETLWAIEEALRATGIGVVIGELYGPPSLTQSRRFQLAAEQGGSLSLLLFKHPPRTSAATMRWICKSMPPPNGKASWDSTLWHWSLKKNKTGTIIKKGEGGGLLSPSSHKKDWWVVHNAKTGSLHLVAAPGSGLLEAPPGP